jgi:hypothetical protein
MYIYILLLNPFRRPATMQISSVASSCSLGASSSPTESYWCSTATPLLHLIDRPVPAALWRAIQQHIGGLLDTEMQSHWNKCIKLIAR